MAAKPRGSTLTDAATVSMADGGPDNRTKEVRQAGRATRVCGMILCKTEKIFDIFRGGVGCRASAVQGLPVRARKASVTGKSAQKFLKWLS